MNKQELVDAVRKALGKETSKAAAEKSVAAVIDAIKRAAKEGRSIKLVGFGTFKVVSRQTRTRRDAKAKIKSTHAKIKKSSPSKPSNHGAGGGR